MRSLATAAQRSFRFSRMRPSAGPCATRRMPWPPPSPAPWFAPSAPSAVLSLLRAAYAGWRAWIGRLALLLGVAWRIREAREIARHRRRLDRTSRVMRTQEARARVPDLLRAVMTGSAGRRKNLRRRLACIQIVLCHSCAPEQRKPKQHHNDRHRPRRNSQIPRYPNPRHNDPLACDPFARTDAAPRGATRSKPK